MGKGYLKFNHIVSYDFKPDAHMISVTVKNSVWFVFYVQLIKNRVSIRLLISLVLLPFSIGLNAQRLSVNHFDMDRNDLSARTSMVKDANGIACALVKISTMDEITKVEGNVVQKVDKGSEVWVYLSQGTKYIKVHTLHHPSLGVNFSNYIHSGLMSNTVYLLELKSDLPPEVLFGSSDASLPVDKAPIDSPALPEWWNMQGGGHYVGISYPSYDGETAKRAAILNAIDLFALDSGMNVIYEAGSYTSNEGVMNQQKYVAKKDGFSLRILQEYYNNKGEYFVLCAISDDGNSTNRYSKQWVYTKIKKDI